MEITKNFPKKFVCNTAPHITPVNGGVYKRGYAGRSVGGRATLGRGIATTTPIPYVYLLLHSFMFSFILHDH